MKNLILLLLCLAVGYNTQAQVPAASIEQLMKNRMYSCYEVEYNAVVVVPELYKNNKADTLDALIRFWKYHCEPNERLFTLNTLNSIRNKTFTEKLSQNDFLSPRIKLSMTETDIYKDDILRYLKEYRESSHGAFSDTRYKEWLKENYALPKDYTDYYNFYKQYYAFLRSMAASMQGKRIYTPIEDFMLRFYANPDSVRFEELDSTIYDGTVLQRQHKAYVQYRDELQGVSTGIEAGTWIPQGPMKVLGNHPYTALRLGGRSDKLIIDVVLGLRFGNSPNTFKVRKDDSTYTSQDYLSWFISIDYGIKMFATRKHELDITYGIGYEEIQVLLISPPENSSNDKTISKSVKSINLNAGLAYRFYVRNKVINNKQKHNYLSLQGKYNYNHYNNGGGTNMLGGAFTIGLVYGGFSHDYTKYPYME